jgi:hypothetical protein
MGWWLRAIVSACFAAAALFVVALWVRSHWTFDRLSAPLAPRRTLILISYRGSVTVTLAELHIPEVWRDSGRSHPIGTRTPDMIWPRERVLGFGVAHKELMLNMPNSPTPPESHTSKLGVTGRSWAMGGSGAMLPDWFLVLILLALAAFPWRRPRFSMRTLLVATMLVAMLATIFSLAARTPEVQWENGVLVTE